METTRSPLTDEQIRTIRSMSLYWQELRGRDNPGDGIVREAMAVYEIVRAGGLLRLAEFAADPVAIAAPDLLEACRAGLLKIQQLCQELGRQTDEQPAAMLDAAIAKAQPAATSQAIDCNCEIDGRPHRNCPACGGSGARTAEGRPA